MKNKIYISLYGIFLSLILLYTGACGSGSSSSTSTTGTPGTISSSNLETSLNSSVPLISNGSGGSISPLNHLSISYGGSSEWNNYITGANVSLLTEIFGSPDVGEATVKKIRVVMDNFINQQMEPASTIDVSNCSSSNSEFNSGLSTLVAGTSLDIAFFGTISNGTAGNAFFDCLMSLDSATTLYGVDSSGVSHVVTMSSSSTVKQVIWSTYVLYVEEGVNVVYFDVQYAQLTTDTSTFKSRTRLTGRTVLSGSSVSIASGDFSTISTDTGTNPQDLSFVLTIQSMGRGNFNSDGDFIFTIASNGGSMTSTATAFCLTSGASLPSAATSTDCSDFESRYAWGSATFPFTITPSISSTYESNSLFTTSDLIEDDGSDFVIPTYTTSD